VAEPNISAWRRTVCGDLTSAFDFTRPDPVPASAIPDPRPDAARAAAIKGQVAPVAPVGGWRPWQEPGIRPHRTLPYDFEVEQGEAEPGKVALRFRVNSGAGVVFHVYDRLALDRIPRRYTVTEGRNLTGKWDADRGYDLWVLGPNGFHRHFVGRAGEAPVAAGWSLDRDSMTLTIASPTSGLIVTPNSFADSHKSWRFAGAGSHRWSLAATDGYYDLTLASSTSPGFRRRLAGRLEAPVSV
jgi:phospholipase C